MDFRQTDINLTRREFQVQETGVHVSVKGLTESNESFVPFEDIGNDVSRDSSRKLIWIILTVSFLLLAVIMLVKRVSGHKIGEGAEIFYFGASIFSYALHLLTQKKTISLSYSITFSDKKRDREKVQAFIDIILKKRNEYLIKKYATLDKLLPYVEQYDNLVWLYNLNILTRHKLEEKINELESLGANRDSRESSRRSRGVRLEDIEEKE